MTTYYIYDRDGFLAGTTEDDSTPRITDIAPEGDANMFTGDGWVFVDRAAWEAQKAAVEAQAGEAAPAPVSPLDKLKAFLAANPDVAAVL